MYIDLDPGKQDDKNPRILIVQIHLQNYSEKTETNDFIVKYIFILGTGQGARKKNAFLAGQSAKWGRGGGSDPRQQKI